MVGKSSKILILFYMIFLVVLFLMCSTDFIIREPEKEVYQIAVIIEDTRDDNYSNFRKGMDQAAIEFNADVHFITLYKKMDAEQQMELIGREKQDGADALIVVPVDERKVLDAVSGKQTGVTAVILGRKGIEEKTAGTILIDYRKMGEQLAEQIVERTHRGCPVFLLEDHYAQNYMNSSFLEGAEDVLESGGFHCQRVKPQGEDGYRKALEALLEKEAVILAGSPEALTETADILGEDPGLSGKTAGLYGRGNTLSILNDLDKGQITGICVTDEFSRGYFSVRMAIQALEGKGNQEPLVMDSYYIVKEDLREPEYEKILFPME